jgi:hypothetical protein
MKNIMLLSLVYLVFGCSNSELEQVESIKIAHFNYDWAMDKIWEDGKAEVAHYNAEMVIYGKVRHFDNVFITVKEEFNEEWNVKTNDYKRSDLFSVMKVNKFARIETENYPYHYLTSLFFKREGPTELYKMTHTGQEWCGNTFKQFLLNNDHYEYDYNSYFDGSGDGEMQIDERNLLWEDQLSYALRALKFEDKLSFEYKVVESQLNTKVRKPTIYQAKFSVSEEPNNWKVEVQLDGEKVNGYLFEKDYPNILLKQTSWNGYNLQLDSVSRYQYWR